MIFVTIEDKSGDGNVVIWERFGVECKQAVQGASLIPITGMIQKEGEVVHLSAPSRVGLSNMLADIGDHDTPLKPPHQPGDEFRNNGP